MKKNDEIMEEAMRLDGLQQKFADLWFTYESLGNPGKALIYNALAQFMFAKKARLFGF